MNDWWKTTGDRPIDTRPSSARDHSHSKISDQKIESLAQKKFNPSGEQQDLFGERSPRSFRASSQKADKSSSKSSDLFKAIKSFEDSTEDAQLRQELLSSDLLSSDWEARSLLPIDYATPFEGPLPVLLQDRQISVENSEAARRVNLPKNRFHYAIEASNAVGSGASFGISFTSSLIKWATHTLSPLASAVPFLGLFNGLANGFAFGKGIDRLRFYQNLEKELRAKAYSETAGNFGPYSARLLAKYPQLAKMEISPSRLAKFLETEVRRKKIKYLFYLASKTLGFGAATVGFLGGLAAFTIPVIAFPAIFLGLPLAILSLCLGSVGNKLAKSMRDPILINNP